MDRGKRIIKLDLREDDSNESYKIRPHERLPFFIGMAMYVERVRKEKLRRMHLPPSEFYPYAGESLKRFGLLAVYNIGTTLAAAWGIEKLLQ